MVKLVLKGTVEQTHRETTAFKKYYIKTTLKHMVIQIMVNCRLLPQCCILILIQSVCTRL